MDVYRGRNIRIDNLHTCHALMPWDTRVVKQLPRGQKQSRTVDCHNGPRLRGYHIPTQFDGNHLNLSLLQVRVGPMK